MKSRLVILILLLTIKSFSQDLQELDIRIREIDTTQPLFDFITFDQSFRTSDSVMVIKLLWVNKHQLANATPFQVNKEYTVIVQQIGPDKQIIGSDTLELRGHARVWDELWLLKEDEADDQRVVQYFKLIEIKKKQ